MILMTEKGEFIAMDEKELVEKLRKKYIANPPEGISPEEIKEMGDSDLLDMDYFLHEECEVDDLDDEFEPGFYLDMF